jgi:flagellar hook-associated protein 1 FlgK
MAGNLLSIGKTGLLAAQTALSTTGHNIANAHTAGYSRQNVIQTTTTASDAGFAFVGNGTQVAQIKRYSDDFLNGQVRSAQTATAGLNTYYAQISQVDNMLADTTSGLSPALQDFFKGLQDVNSNPASAPSRQALLSSAESLAARFQGIDNRLADIRSGISGQITSSTTLINSYAQQIAALNEQIGAYATNENVQPNDLLDKRDFILGELNKQVKTSVVTGDSNSMTVSIGNGQPLVVGKKSYDLLVTNAPGDLSRLVVGFKAGSTIVPLAENSFGGGELGGLMDVRAGALDRAQGEIDRVAAVMANQFNNQHKLGQDLNGSLGTDLFYAPPIPVNYDSANVGNGTLTATLTDSTLLTGADYKLRFDGVNYALTRLPNTLMSNTTLASAAIAAQGDGFTLNLAAGAIPTALGDNYLIHPTKGAAANFRVLISDTNLVAVAAPIRTASAAANTGNGKISEGSVDAAYLPANGGTPIIAPANVTLTYNRATTSLSGFPPAQSVTVTTNGVATLFPAPVANVPYTAGSSFSFGGINFSISGTPANNDTFTMSQNVSGVGDDRNGRALGALQTANLVNRGTATLQGAYAATVSFVGNKTREAQVNGQASEALLAQATAAQQNVSGVNLDEEASDLLRYQQAYQAAGKVMQIASTLFDTLLSLGR